MAAKSRGLIFHRKQRGKAASTWSTTVGNKVVTLKEKDPDRAADEARALRAEYRRTSAAGAADGITHSDDQPSAQPNDGPKDTPPPASTPTPAAGASPKSTGGNTATDEQREGAGNTEKASGGFAADINGAAEEVRDKARADRQATIDDEDDEEISDEDLDDMLDEIVTGAAFVAVEVQIRIQEWCFRRYGKIEAAQIPLTHPVRAAGVRRWDKIIRRMMPKTIPIPPWVVAIAMVGYQTAAVQMGPGAHKVGEPPPRPRAADDDNVVDAHFTDGRKAA